MHQVTTALSAAGIQYENGNIADFPLINFFSPEKCDDLFLSKISHFIKERNLRLNFEVTLNKVHNPSGGAPLLSSWEFKILWAPERNIYLTLKQDLEKNTHKDQLIHGNFRDVRYKFPKNFKLYFSYFYKPSDEKVCSDKIGFAIIYEGESCTFDFKVDSYQALAKAFLNTKSNEKIPLSAPEKDVLALMRFLAELKFRE